MWHLCTFPVRFAVGVAKGDHAAICRVDSSAGAAHARVYDYSARTRSRNLCGPPRLRAYRLGTLVRSTTLFFEAHDGLTARDGDFAIDNRTLCYGDAAGDDVRANDRACPHLELRFDHEFSSNASRDDGRLGVNLAFPLRGRRHAQGTADAPVTADGTAYDQRPASLHVTRKAAALCKERWRDAKLVN